jgi:hypothetical protein
MDIITEQTPFEAPAETMVEVEAPVEKPAK